MRNKPNHSRKIVMAVLALFALCLVSMAIQAQRQPSSKILNLGLYEGESLVKAGNATANGGAVSAQQMSGFGAGWSGDAQLFWGGGKPGAVLDLELDVLDAGNYEIELRMTRAPDFGLLRMQVENKDVTAKFDGYASLVTLSEPISLGTFYLAAGKRKVSFMIEGKNAKSSNYFAGIDYVRLTKKRALANTVGTPPQWKITDLTTQPKPTHVYVFKYKNEPPANLDAYLEGEDVTVTCSYKQSVSGVYAQAFVAILDNGKNLTKVGITEWQGGSRTLHWHPEGSGEHLIKCRLSVLPDSGQETMTDEKTVMTWVTAKN